MDIQERKPLFSLREFSRDSFVSLGRLVLITVKIGLIIGLVIEVQIISFKISFTIRKKVYMCAISVELMFGVKCVRCSAVCPVGWA
jgi:hypothetical protein